MTRRIRLGLVTTVAVAVVLLATALASAFAPGQAGRPYEIRLPEFAPAAPGDLAARESAAVSAMVGQYGGRWHAYDFSAHTGAPRWLYGSGPRLAPSVADEADAALLARRVLNEVTAALPLAESELRLTDTPHLGGKWAAHFQQTYHGVDVWQARATVVLSDDGRLMAVGSDYRRGIAVDPRPALGAAEAVALAQADLPFATDPDDEAAAPTLLVLPVAISAGEEEFHLVWRVRLRSEDPLGAWVTHVDAHDGRTIWRYNDIYFEYLGTTASDVREDTYCLGSGVQAMPYLRATITGVATVYADADGNWSAPGSGGSRTVTADLYSPYVDLDNVAGAEAAFAGTAEEDVSLPIVFGDLNSREDERDVFDAVNDLHDFFESFAPGFGYSNQRIIAYVGRTGGLCPGNAWWNGTINFCEAGSGYANTGEIQGVVHHEFGHGVQDFILGYQGGTGMGEGNSDILANLMTQESIIGRGFYQDGCTAGIRDSDNNLVYPTNVVGQEDHFAGQVIAGFNWDAMALMQAILGQEQGTHIAARNWHEGRVLLHPADMPSQVLATFIADDDDGDLDNGTPHHAYYCQAAQNHGFACPAITVGVLMSHTPMADTIDSGPFAVQASIISTEAALDQAQLMLVYRAAGGTWNETPLASAGGNVFEGTIPIQSGGDVEYYFTAGDLGGNVARLPALAPDYFYSFLVATSIDALEAESGWTAGLAGDTATSGIWVRVDPIGTIAQPEFDHTTTGTLCWVTGQHVAGQGDGYNDVDAGRTTLTSPIWDVTGFDQVDLRYWKWYSNDRGSTPGTDWWDVQISNDGGTSWVALEHTMQSSQGWEAVNTDLVALFGAPDQLQLRFVATDEGSGSLIEAGVDDVAIVALSSISGVDGGDLAVRVVTELDQNVPNPFNPLTEISFSLARPGQASLKVFDVQGRLVRVLIEGQLAAGPQRVVWDGAGNDGRPVASGVYFYRLETPDGLLGKRMLLIK